MIYKCGEKPGKGRYICIKCKEDLYLDDDTDSLPPCKGRNGTCKGCEFNKG